MTSETTIGTINIWKHMADAGVHPVPWKPQLSRGGYIFTCPMCGYSLNSHHYTILRAFEDACLSHMEETHYRQCIHYDYSHAGCEFEGRKCFCQEFDRRVELLKGGGT